MTVACDLLFPLVSQPERPLYVEGAQIEDIADKTRKLPPEEQNRLLGDAIGALTHRNPEFAEIVSGALPPPVIEHAGLTTRRTGSSA